METIKSWLLAAKEELRRWVKSRTIWFSTVGVPLIMALFSYAEANLPLVRDNLGASYGVVAFIIGVIGIILRRVTTVPLSEK